MRSLKTAQFTCQSCLAGTTGLRQLCTTCKPQMLSSWTGAMLTTPCCCGTTWEDLRTDGTFDAFLTGACFGGILPMSWLFHVRYVQVCAAPFLQTSVQVVPCQTFLDQCAIVVFPVSQSESIPDDSPAGFVAFAWQSLI